MYWGKVFAVVVGCVLFGMHFSQSKNALLLNYLATFWTYFVKFVIGQNFIALNDHI